MVDKPKGGFRFEEFFITNFQINRKPISQSDKPLDIEYTPTGVISKKTSSYTLGLKVKLSDPDGSFNMEIDSLGFFNFDNSEAFEEMKPIFFLNAPAIMFPYIRSFVASVTALSGLEAVHLPVSNLAFLKSQVEENTTFDDTEDV